MIRKRKIFFTLTALTVVFALCFVAERQEKHRMASTVSASPYTVIVDAGHGGLTNTTD